LRFRAPDCRAGRSRICPTVFANDEMLIAQ
jgi:hypothetical protein